MTVTELHPQAKDLLRILQEHESATVAELEQDRAHGEIMRPAQWLAEKDLIEIVESTTERYVLTDTGEQALDDGLPEEQVLELVQGGEANMDAVQSLGEIAGPGIGKAKEKGLVEIRDGVVQLTDSGEEMLDAEHTEMAALKAVRDDRDIDEDIAEKLQDRGLIRQEEETRRTLTVTETGTELDIDDITDAFDVEAAARDALVGRKHFAREVYDYIRQVWIEMGFQEMDGPIVVPSLLNFDALYTPQDHPARELHDTFFMENPRTSELSGFEMEAENVRETHESGWTTGSTGWNYDWSEEEAARNVMRTHTTAATIRRIHEIEINEEDLPKKFFILGRNFRNETVDRHHLAEFYQTDGIVVGEDLNYRNLKAYLSEFFEKMGYEKFRMIPSYYPYTEMSTEVQVYDEKAEEWIGLGGAGMFRPEVVKPMLGVEARVLAWGLGIGRIAMKAAEIDDIRELYRNDIKLIEETPRWRPES